MYLIIWEDGQIMKTSTLSDDDLSACDDGYCELIDIANPESPLYYNEVWGPIEEKTNEN